MSSLGIHHLSTSSSLHLICCDRTELSATSQAQEDAPQPAAGALPRAAREPRLPDDGSSVCGRAGGGHASTQERVPPPLLLLGGWFSPADGAGVSCLLRLLPHPLPASPARHFCFQTACPGKFSTHQGKAEPKGSAVASSFSS